MVNLRIIRETVLAKLAAIRNASEEVIHETYARAISSELMAAKDNAIQLRQLLTEARVRHPQHGWVMLERGEVERFEALLSQFVENLR